MSRPTRGNGRSGSPLTFTTGRPSPASTRASGPLKAWAITPSDPNQAKLNTAFGTSDADRWGKSNYSLKSRAENLPLTRMADGTSQTIHAGDRDSAAAFGPDMGGVGGIWVGAPNTAAQVLTKPYLPLGTRYLEPLPATSKSALPPAGDGNCSRMSFYSGHQGG